MCLSLIAATAGAAEAGLLGSTVDVSVYFPDTATLFAADGPTLVSAAVKYPAGSFNGFIMTILAGPALRSVVADPATSIRLIVTGPFAVVWRVRDG